MATRTRVKFDKEKLRKAMMKNLVTEQTRRLVQYAKEELYEMIVTRQFESRTFNLADSYVWAVYFDGKEQSHGHIGSKMANDVSYLHEWSRDPSKRIPVDGRKEATAFLSAFQGHLPTKDGWVVVWAACAPYARYLDPAAGSTKTNRFFVISQRYDHIKNTFSPKGHVTFSVKPL